MATTLTASPSATSQALASHEQHTAPHTPTKLSSAPKLASPSPARGILQANRPMASPMRRRPTFEVYASSDEDSDDDDDFVDAASHVPFGITTATKDSEDAYSTASSDVEPESEYEDAQDSVGLYDMFHSRAVDGPAPAAVAAAAEAKRERTSAATSTDTVEDRLRERPSFLRKVQRSTDFGPQFGHLRQAALTSASSSRTGSIRTATEDTTSSDDDQSQESEIEGHPLTRQKRRRFVGEEGEREERMANIHVAITPVKVRGSMWECE